MLRLAICLALVGSMASAQTGPVPDAAASDPVAQGWMQGEPPPADKIIRFDDGSAFKYPQWRWSLSHWRELAPTTDIARGAGPVSKLPRAERKDIDAISFMPIGGTQPMTWEQSLAANYTDGIVVLHKGRIVYERYFGALKPERPHMAFSVTKSFFGTIAATLIEEGKLDANARVDRYIPELKDSGFADATVQQVLDMTTALKFSEVYGDPNSQFMDHARAAGFMPRPADYKGASGTYAYLATIAKQGEHGERFTYRSINTDVVGWLIARVTGKPPQEVLRERIWDKIGAEGDAYMLIDPAGTVFAAGGFNPRLRDLARFGETMRLGGKFNGQQIVPAAVVARIAKGGDPERFAKTTYTTLPGGSYANQWWFTHNEHAAYTARGIHGQAIYIDPKAEMVIARFASHHIAGNVGIDPTSLPAYHALAKHLMAKRR
ncbi:MAG: beta-lactamase family protein [Qipengyuania sp.]|nr:beta-lactamase family protein [Qipengyuania sp.]